jgi:hypothetical protein
VQNGTPCGSSGSYCNDGSCTGSVTAMPVGQSPVAILFDGDDVWVVNNFDGTVSRIPR